MRVTNTLRLSLCLLGLSLFSDVSFSHAQTNGCDDISKDVASAIEKDPSKTLMIVEDALVINESCACEIIKAAISAAKADSAMVNQIVQTGIAVAPKMSGVIMDCASSIAPGAVATSTTTETDPTASEKNPVKNPVPVAPEEEEFIPMPGIRGIYLLQPPPTSYIPDPRNPGNPPVSPIISAP